MKKGIFLIVILLTLLSFDSKAQSTLFTNINGPNGIAIKDNFLYVITTNEILKADITIENPPLIQVVDGITGGAKIAFYGNELYIADFFGYKISKIDVTETNPILVDVITGIFYPDAIVFNENNLYFTYVTDTGEHNVGKIDVLQSNPAITDIITDTIFLLDLAIKDDILYASTSFPHKVFKININESNPLPEDVYTTGNAIHGLAINEDNLYLANIDESKISKIDITQSVPVPNDIATNLDLPFYLAFNDTDLYFSSFIDDTISKIDLNALGINELININNIKTYPNPTEDLLYISGFENIVKYEVLNITGQKLLTGHISENSYIDINSLENGVYFIRLEDRINIKVLKK